MVEILSRIKVSGRQVVATLVFVVLSVLAQMAIPSLLGRMINNGVGGESARLVIAHRLSTIRDANVILYMENGDIKEMGSHDALMKQNGRYAELYNSQFA